MTTTTLYGFLIDDALRLSPTELDLNKHAFDQDFGLLYGEAAAYLVKPGYIYDNRSLRSEILDNSSAAGKLAITFDIDQIDTSLLKALTPADITAIFNILERIYLQQMYKDSVIESVLTTDEKNYPNYVAGSFHHSVDYSTVKITDSNQKQLEIKLTNWIAFEYKTDEVDLCFHIWINRHDFFKNYPYTTITKVIPPYEPRVLVSPATLSAMGVLSALSAGAANIFKNADLEASVRNQNGIYTYQTIYCVTKTRKVMLPFALAYCGAKTPTALACRIAIKDYLLSNTELNEDALRQLFPDLFVNSRFYVIPLWDTTTIVAGREVDNAILSYRTLITKANQLYGKKYESPYLEDHLEIIPNSYSTMYSLCMPDAMNTEYDSIRTIHPTYTDYSSTQAAFAYMTQATQEFNNALAGCIAVLAGASASANYQVVEDGGDTWLTFSSGVAEYYVLSKESYFARV